MNREASGIFAVRYNMRLPAILLLAALLLAGCATSTVEKRKQERAATYAALSSEFKAAVDQGNIKIGMNEEAVYLAWGKPSQTLQSESPRGAMTTWLYHGSRLVEHRYWAYHSHSYGHGYGYYSSPFLTSEYYSRGFVQAEVVFESGVVKEWRRLPAPAD